MSVVPPRLPLRAAACEVAAVLAQAGHEALFAGGCVRDLLLGDEPKDFDIATSATPEEIRAVFPKARGVGESFGVMLVRHAGYTFEVATFREDEEYLDGRRPSGVRFSDARADAQRRDFTINALFQRPDTGDIIDYVDGRADFAAKILRAVGHPHERIREDRLRMLRAVRFAARFGFVIDPETARAIEIHARELAAVSAERTGDEVRRMLRDPSRLQAARLIERFGLDEAVFGCQAQPHDWIRLGGVVIEGLGIESQRSPSVGVSKFEVALAAWWLDRNAPAGGGSIPRPLDAELERAVGVLRAKLVLSNEETFAVLSTLRQRETLLSSFDRLPLAGRVRVAARPGFDAALEILRAETPMDAARWRIQADRELPDRQLPEPLLDGRMLLEDGMHAGPRFKLILEAALDAQIEGRVVDTRSALALARELAHTAEEALRGQKARNHDAEGGQRATPPAAK